MHPRSNNDDSGRHLLTHNKVRPLLHTQSIRIPKVSFRQDTEGQQGTKSSHSLSHQIEFLWQTLFR